MQLDGKAVAKEVGTQGVTVLLASDVGAGVTGAIDSVDGGTAA